MIEVKYEQIRIKNKNRIKKGGLSGTLMFVK